jgi:hypothetical protein
MKASLLGLWFGLLLGAGLAFGWFYNRSNAPEAEQIDQVVEGAKRLNGVGSLDELLELREALMQSQGRVNQLERQNLDLAVRVQGLLARGARSSAQESLTTNGIPGSNEESGVDTGDHVPDEDPEELAQRMALAIAMRVESEIETRIARMKRRQNLSPERELEVRSRLRELLEETYGLTGPDLEIADVDGEGEGDVEDDWFLSELDANLDPEGFLNDEPVPPQETSANPLASNLPAVGSSTEADRVRDVQTLAIERADFELAQYRSWITLSAPQQHQLAILLVEFYRAILDPRFGMSVAASDMQLINQKLSAIRASNILTEPQLREISQRQLQQLNQIRAMDQESARLPTGFGEPASM